MRQRCEVHRAGLVDYERAWAWQQDLLVAVQSGDTAHHLILLEHAPVFTIGRGGRSEHLLADDTALAARGAAFHRIDRGGDITFHGPGQIVAYPIFDLRQFWGGIDIPRYICALQAVITSTLAGYGIGAGCREGKPGVWIGDDKIAAIGVRVSRGVTMHGFALNVSTDLSYFDMIVPCGIRDGGVTSMERELGVAPSMGDVMDSVTAAFEQEFGVDTFVREAVAA